MLPDDDELELFELRDASIALFVCIKKLLTRAKTLKLNIA
jgi:hypothetical protein